MKHFVHYLPRRIILPASGERKTPWFSSYRNRTLIERPVIHVTRRKTGPAARVAAGDCIWVFSELVSPWGRLPPALDFMLEVARVAPIVPGGECGFRYIGGRNSQWFHLYDARELLGRLKTIDKNESITELWAQPDLRIGTLLQSMREVQNGEELLHFARSLSKRELEFISYRTLDGTRPAFAKATELVADGTAVFFDRWSLPRGLAERREFLPPHLLNPYIRRRMGQASKVWAIESPQYAARGSYSLEELKHARQLKKPLIWVGKKS